MVFPVVMYGCERWTIKKAEHRRIDAFELWCWRRLLRVPWTARRSNQAILKETSSEYSLEGLILKQKLQYFSHLMQKTLMLGKIEVRRRRGQQRMRCWMASLTQWTWVWVNSGSWWWTGRPGVLQSMGLPRVIHDWATEGNWTEVDLDELIRAGPYDGINALIRGGRETRARWLSLFLSAIGGHNEQMAMLKPGRGCSPELSLLALWYQTPASGAVRNEYRSLTRSSNTQCGVLL